MIHFIDNEEGYLDWLTEHPHGFVVNCLRKPTPTYLKLHSVSCSHISTSKRTNYTSAAYSKICSDSEQELIDWAAAQGWLLDYCGHCGYVGF